MMKSPETIGWFNAGNSAVFCLLTKTKEIMRQRNKLKRSELSKNNELYAEARRLKQERMIVTVWMMNCISW